MREGNTWEQQPGLGGAVMSVTRDTCEQVGRAARMGGAVMRLMRGTCGRGAQVGIGGSCGRGEQVRGSETVETIGTGGTP